MAKKNDIKKVLATVTEIAVALVIAGLFLDGTTLVNPILKYVPEMIHTIAGWALIVVAIGREVLRHIK